MKTFTTTAILTLVASIVSTAPAPAPQDYSGFEAQITFQGAAGAQFIESIPANGNQYNIGKLPYSSTSSFNLANDRQCPEHLSHCVARRCYLHFLRN
jgi:hypothetical protein